MMIGVIIIRYSPKIVYMNEVNTHDFTGDGTKPSRNE